MMFVGPINTAGLPPSLACPPQHIYDKELLTYPHQIALKKHPSLLVLQVLLIGSTCVADLSPLSAASSPGGPSLSLQHLNCSCTEVSDLSPLAACGSLRSLDCSSNPRIKSLAPLLTPLARPLLGGPPLAPLGPLLVPLDSPPLASSRPCRDLEYLDCSCTNVPSLEPLTACTALRSLYCSGLPYLTGLDGCPPGLEKLTCSCCPGVWDLAPLAVCSGLRMLVCEQTSVSSLGPLATRTSLQVRL